MKQNKTNLILIAVFLLGLALLVYPSVSNYWNSFHATRAIASYSEQVAELDNTHYRQLWQAAEAYNQTLAGKSNRWVLSDGERAQYEALLDVSGTGIIGYVEIPEIRVSLPIYHGVDEAVLQIAAGHIEGSSLPVGGTGTHCVLSGHRGLPSARLFTDLDQLTEGDVFMLRVLDEVLTYEIDQIHIVEPQELQDLELVPGQDYCTLVTCTPYGINSHRLLVRGHRIANANEDDIRVTADALTIEPLLVAPVVAAPILLVLLILVLLGTRKKPDRTDKAERL